MTPTLPTTDEQALRAAVMEKPQDDAPRLVYADWLDEHGEEDRGSFIRVQVKLARVGFLDDGKPCPCQNCKALRRRERALSYAHLQTWFPPTPDGSSGIIAYTTTEHGRSSGPAQIVSRGFVAEVRCPMAAWYTPCDRCNGTGMVDAVDPASGRTTGEWQRQCPVCKTAGRLPGAWRVARTEPVTVVRTEREPHAHPNGQYSWSLGPDPDDGRLTPFHRDLLPGWLWKLLPRIDQRTGYRWYATRDAALAALSDALIRWARERSAT